MSGAAPGVDQVSDGSYAWSPHLLPGAVVATVGYALSGAAPSIHRGLPSPYLTFIFGLDGPVVSGCTAAEALSPAAARTEIVVAGLHRRPTYVVQPTEQLGIQLAVHPLAARMLFGAPAAEIPWQVTEGVDVIGAAVGHLRDRLVEGSSWAERFEVLAGYLRQRQRDSKAPPPRAELVEGWDWLSRRRGAASMEALARHLALSPRQLRAIFVRELGVSPKQIARLMRFDAVKQRLSVAVAGDRGVTLSDLAARCGFYDHPHLDAEFRAFSGVSPTEWVAEERRNIQAGGHRSGEDWGHDDP
ncbi:MAG TPA: helix-turn-helix domain-containing protein [Propionibacteriaceae bacterium]